jgi:tetratricopeptide (TPR) repeat protein
LYDAVRGGQLVRERTRRIAAALTGLDSAAATIIDRLLFTDSSAAGGTRSFPARGALERGLAAVREWELAGADSAFDQAARHDGNYARAHLWLAQVRFWAGADRVRWQSAAERARAGREQLAQSDQAVGDALVLMASGDLPRGCGAFQGLTLAEPFDFAGWYGLARCLTRDEAVVADSRSPSRWRFRSSYHQALKAYQRAFQLLPAIHRSLQGSGYLQARNLFWTGGGAIRRGRSLTRDSLTFDARPAWEGDSLVFIPYPRGQASSAVPGPTYALALQRLKELFRDVATAWVAAYPEEPSALEALGVSFEMLNDPSCIDTLRRARAIAVSPDTRSRLAGTEAWMRLKLAIPLDLANIRAARSLADSLLAVQPARGADTRLLASLAALTGRAHLAAALYETSSVEWRAPAPIARPAARLLVYSVLGGPADSLAILEERVARAIDNGVAMAERADARLVWLARPATLAFPHHRMSAIQRLGGQGDPLLDAQAAFVGSDTTAVRRYFDTFRSRRRNYPPESLTLDGLYPESALLAAWGKPRDAADWVEPTLDNLSSTAPLVFTDPARAGALVQAMALRAELAARLGDRATAARWARVVAVLWSDADDFLLPLVRRMEQLAR